MLTVFGKRGADEAVAGFDGKRVRVEGQLLYRDDRTMLEILPADAAPVLREFMGDVRPANTAVVCDLIAPEMKIEIEATAYRGA